jgi:hypothetical protein
MCVLRASGEKNDSDVFLLDSPIELRIDGETVVAQFDRFPASLVRPAGFVNDPALEPLLP